MIPFHVPVRFNPSATSPSVTISCLTRVFNRPWTSETRRENVARCCFPVRQTVGHKLKRDRDFNTGFHISHAFKHRLLKNVLPGKNHQSTVQSTKEETKIFLVLLSSFDMVSLVMALCGWLKDTFCRLQQDHHGSSTRTTKRNVAKMLGEC